MSQDIIGSVVLKRMTMDVALGKIWEFWSNLPADIPKCLDNCIGEFNMIANRLKIGSAQFSQRGLSRQSAGRTPSHPLLTD